MAQPLKTYRYCPDCGAPLSRGVKFGRDRAFCRYCHFIHFIDPKVAVGALVTDGDRVLLVRRGAIPRRGYWALPAGFMDADEDPEAAVAREILEETGVRARIGALRCVTTLGGWEQRHGLLLLYTAELEAEDAAAAGDDVTDAAWFSPQTIPWDALAFESTETVLREWAAIRNGP